jgi:hypothetical protein
MAKETYKMPVNPTACFDFQSNTINLSKANAVAWNIPEEKMKVIDQLQSDYEKKYLVANNKSTRSVATTAARDAAWELLKDELIGLYDHYILNNDAISVADKEALHLHYLVGGGGTSSPAPTTTPIVTLSSEEISVLHVNYADSASPGTHAKPDNVAFCELWYKVDAPAPVNPYDCPGRCNVSRSHDEIVFTPDDRGKIVYGYAHWVNKNGRTGPWSGLISAIVP